MPRSRAGVNRAAIRPPDSRFATRKPLSTRPMSVKIRAMPNTARLRSCVRRGRTGPGAEFGEPAVMEAGSHLAWGSVVRGRHAIDAKDMRKLIEPPPIDFREQFALTVRKLRQGQPGVRPRYQEELGGWKLAYFGSDLQSLPKAGRQIVGDGLRVVAENDLALMSVRHQDVSGRTIVVARPILVVAEQAGHQQQREGAVPGSPR